MPRYEFVEGSSSKFWEIELEGNAFTVTYGKIGTDGQTSTKEFDDEAKARKEYDKIIASKVKKGYELVASEDGDDGDDDGDGDEDAPEAPSNPALEQAIYADPNARDAWVVYADWLQSIDDPRGALVAAYANEKSTTALQKKLGPALNGRIGGDLAGYANVTWRMGYWDTLKVFCDYDSAESFPDEVEGIAGVLRYAFAHPSARFLRALNIGLTESFTDGEATWEDCLAALAEAPRPALRELFVGDFERVDDTEISWTEIGDHGPIWAMLPNLESFKVQGCGIEFGTIVAPNLRSLTVWSGGLGAEPVEAIGAAKLPKLEKLELWFGSDNYGAECTVGTLAGILGGKGLPKVTWLGLMNGEFANDLCSAVVDAPILQQLHTLDLSMGTMTDDGARVLIANAKKLAHLKRLNLDDNFLTPEVAAQLTAALPNASVAAQGNPNDYIYVTVGE